jgi:hypothetical protein
MRATEEPLQSGLDVARLKVRIPERTGNWRGASESEEK